MSSSSATEFGAYINGLILKQKDTPLELSQAIVIVKNVKMLLSHNDKLPNSHAIVVQCFAKILKSFPRSAEFVPQFNDPNFLSFLIKFAIQNPLDDYVYSVLVTYLTGDVFPQTTTYTNMNNDSYSMFVKLLMSDKNMRLIENLGYRYQNMTLQSCEINMRFVSAIYNVACYLPNLEFTIKLAIVNRRTNLSMLYRKFQKSQKAVNKTVSPKLSMELMFSIAQMYLFMEKNLGLIVKSKSYDDLLTDVCSMIKKLTHFSTANLTESQIYERCGFTSNPKKFLYKEYNISTLLSVFVLSVNPLSQSFLGSCEKQHRLCGINCQKKYPIGSFLFEISKLLSTILFGKSNPNSRNISNFRFYMDEIFLAVLKKSLYYWTNSNANNEVLEDYLYIMNLLKIDLQYLNTNLTDMSEFDNAIQSLETNMTYDKVRRIQMRFLQNDQYASYVASTDLENYKEMLKENVKMFVINERLIEMTRGSFCYLKKPFNASSKIALSLSPKRNALMYKPAKDFDPKVQTLAGYLTKNYKTVQLHNVKRIEVVDNDHRNIEHRPQQNANFVFISSKNNATQIKLFTGADDEVFSFFTDNKRTADLWIDTLNLIVDNFRFTNVTDDTKYSLQQLFDIKKKLQLVPLSGLYNNSLLEMYTTVGVSKTMMKTSTLMNIDKFEQFIEYTDIDFTEDTESDKAKFQKNLNKNKFGLNEVDEKESEFDYQYDELIGIANNFYYN